MNAIEKIGVHDHLCLIYRTREEQFAAVIPFIRTGIEQGEKCVYIVDDNTADSVLEAMRAGGIDVDGATESGMLVVATKREAYLKEGFFDPDMMIDFLKENTDLAKEEGFSALRVTGEMTWALGEDPGAERLIEYESKLNYFFPNNAALAICQYNRNRFKPEIILDVIKTHPMVIYGNLVCKNLYYVPSDEFLKPGQSSLEVERMLDAIHSREQAEKALKGSERKYRELIQTMQEGVWVIDRDSYTEFVNPLMAEMMGYTVEEMIGRHLFEFMDDEGVAIAKRDLERRRQGESGVFDFELLKKDGTRLCATIGVAPITDEDGRYAGAVAAIMDITERKRAEKELENYRAHLEDVVEKRTAELKKTNKQLRQEIEERKRMEDVLRHSEEKFRITSENTYDWEFWIGPDNKYIYVSPSCKRISGYGPEEFFADPKLRKNIIHPEDLSLFERHLAEQEKQKPGELEYRIIRSDGALRWIGHVCQPVYDSEGRFIGTRGSNRDLTDRKAAETGLKVSEEKYRTLFESMLNGSALHEIILDENGKPCDYRFIEVNKSFEELTGLKRESVIGKTVLEVLPKTEHFWIETYGKVALTGEPVRFENYSRGLEKYFEVIAYSPRKGQFAAVFADITERKKMENELRRAKEELEIKVMERTAELKETLSELEQSNKELEQFAYVASHDMQEPLRMVSSYLQLIALKYKGRLDEEADRFITFAVDGSSRMEQMIKDLLEFSRLQSRAKPFEKTDCNGIVKQALSNLDSSVRETGAVVTSAPLPTVMADGGQLMRLFQNLIANAIKFRRPDAPPSVNIGSEETGNEWLFYVRDNGIGIEFQDREKIFVIFERVHGRKYAGTGIGLSVCKRIVERHNGRIWVESEPGKGSVFYFTIPKRQKKTVRLK